MASPKGIDGDTQPELTPLRVTTSSRETPAAPEKATAERKQTLDGSGSQRCTHLVPPSVVCAPPRQVHPSRQTLDPVRPLLGT